jgi:S1-C subfamily serine protease
MSTSPSAPTPAALCVRRGARVLSLATLLATLFVPLYGRAGLASPAVRPAAAQSAVDADRFFDAIVKIVVRAVPDARSSETLGPTREGTGVVIGANGLIVTIGYLLVEADDVQIVDHAGRRLPARVVGYDHPTGLGLVRTVVPFDAPPIALGDSGTVSVREPVLVVNYEAENDVTLAHVVSKRAFTGSWEYLLDSAIFTSPPASNWSGAALIGPDLKLIGVGSLIMRDASADDDAVPGNMFVPIDLLKPILDDLVRDGHRAGSARPWLGVAADEVQGRLVVRRVSADGPAERAGLRSGDIILAVEGERVRTQAQFYRKLWSSGAAGANIKLRVLQDVDVQEITVHSIDRIQYFRPRTTY